MEVYRRLLTVQDISCLGQCSMTVAMPVLSACGHETCIMPTAMLSTHTGGFQQPAIRQLADGMASIREHWKREHITFDAIYTGYLGSKAAVAETYRVIEELLAPGGTVIVDPAMADNGKLYSGFDDAYVQAMTELCRRADIILPNITEAALLAGLPYRESLDPVYVRSLMIGLNHPCVVLTGVGYTPEETGIAVFQENALREYHHPQIGKSFHGTGDLFAACFAGAYLRGKTLMEAVQIAGDVVCLSIQNTVNSPKHWYGVKFETAIPELIDRLNQ